MDNKAQIKSYVLRASRMSTGQKKAFDSLFSKHCIEYSEQKIDFSKYFRSDNLYIEIGFGMGTATAQIASHNPDMNFIGIEVHRPGVGRLLMKIEELGLVNLKIVNHDAVEVLTDMIPEGSVDGFHIFFPDPWPKKKHHKRRLINDDFTKLMIQKLKRDGYIYTATDWDNYAEQMLDVFSRNPSIKNRYKQWAESPVWRPETAFERKGKNKNHSIHELFFTKV